MNNFHELIAKRIRRLLKARHWTQYKLSQRSAIPQSTISYILKGKGKFLSSETLLNICRGFDIRIVDFFDDELFEPENIADNF